MNRLTVYISPWEIIVNYTPDEAILNGLRKSGVSEYRKNAMGSGDIEAAEYYFKKLYRMTLAGSIVWNILIFAVMPVIMLAYLLSDEIIHLVIVLVFNLFNAAAFPASGALPNGLRAAGDVRCTMYVAVASTIIIRFVLSVILGVWMDLGVIGVAAAMCCDWMVRAVWFLRRFHSGQWKKFQVIEE